MDSGYYAAYAGLLARSEALDTAASNLANAGTSGFRAERDYFRGLVVGEHAADSQVNAIVNDYGVLGGNRLDFGQGPIAATGNPLDLAIQGSGFFSIQTPQGIRYTRDGAFQISKEGLLVTDGGEPVLDAQHAPIHLPSADPVIGADGSISIEGAIFGQVATFDFASPDDIQPEGTNRYATVQGVKPTLAKGVIRQGSLESSNQDVIQGTLQLILVQRQSEMMQKALSMFHGDFDKTAAEDIPRV